VKRESVSILNIDKKLKKDLEDLKKWQTKKGEIISEDDLKKTLNKISQSLGK